MMEVNGKRKRGRSKLTWRRQAVEGFVVGQWDNVINRLLRHGRVVSAHSDRRLLRVRIRGGILLNFSCT